MTTAPDLAAKPKVVDGVVTMHRICARKLFLRPGVDEERRVVEDVVKFQKWVYDMQSRTLRLEYIVLPDVEEGSIAMWANLAIFCHGHPSP